MWDRLKFISGGGSILTVTEAKSQLRIPVSVTDDDAWITSTISAAQAFIEGPRGIGVALLNQTWELRLDGWPKREITIPLSPVSAVNSITYQDLSNTTQTLATSLYVYDTGYDPFVIRRAYGAYWPVVLPQPGTVKVNFTTGYGASASSVPLDLRHAMLLLISHFYEHRDAVVGVESRDSSAELPLGVSSILERYRSGRIA